jgi:hypothetical protein
MWAAEHSIETDATPERIWAVWADVSAWPAWNGDIERVELLGPFAAGSRIVMTPIGDAPIELRMADASQPELFVDEAAFGPNVIRTTHRVMRLADGRSRITYRMEIEGPEGAEIGPQISADFPETLASLARCAES